MCFIGNGKEGNSLELLPHGGEAERSASDGKGRRFEPYLLHKLN